MLYQVAGILICKHLLTKFTFFRFFSLFWAFFPFFTSNR